MMYSQTTTIGNKLYLTTFGYTLRKCDERFSVGDFNPTEFLQGVSAEQVNNSFTHNETYSFESSSSDKWQNFEVTFNPLHIALKIGDFELIKGLLEKGANVNEPMKSHMVFEVSYVDLQCRRTADESNDRYNRNVDSKYPLDMATNEELIALLRSHGGRTAQEIIREQQSVPTP